MRARGTAGRAGLGPRAGGAPGAPAPTAPAARARAAREAPARGVRGRPPRPPARGRSAGPPRAIALAALALAATLAVGRPVFPGPAPPPAAAPVEPAAPERQSLARGEVVYRRGAAPRDGVPVPGARGATAFVRVPAEPAAVWTILTAPRRYPEIFPGLRAVTVLAESPGAWLLRTEGKVGPFDFHYHTRYEVRPEAWHLAWRLDATRDNDVFDDHWGWWQLVPQAGGTLVVYAVGSIPASWQPLAGVFERRGIIRALAALRDAAGRR